MISVLLADDHVIVSSGLKYIIDCQHDMKVMYEAENEEEVVQKNEASGSVVFLF